MSTVGIAVMSALLGVVTSFIMTQIARYYGKIHIEIKKKGLHYNKKGVGRLSDDLDEIEEDTYGTLTFVLDIYNTSDVAKVIKETHIIYKIASIKHTAVEKKIHIPFPLFIAPKNYVLRGFHASINPDELKQIDKHGATVYFKGLKRKGQFTRQLFKIEKGRKILD